MSWTRVTKSNPCVICGKSSWCMIAPKGDAVLCMRETSERSYTLKNGETGYFHTLKDAPVLSARKEKPRPEPVINVGKLMRRWREETPADWIDDLGRKLYVEGAALDRLGVAYAQEHRAWAFPMSDGYGNLVGIRLRSESGFKWTVEGTHTGIFVPNGQPHRTALIAEGPTDTAAALSLGFFAIGRPSCRGGVHDTLILLRRLGIKAAVIVIDCDEAGSSGGRSLQDHLKIRSTILPLPTKDLRKFVESGGTRELLDSMIENLTWENP